MLLDNYKERREYKRYAVKGIRGDVQCSADMSVININPYGATIETPKRLDLNRDYRFRIYFNGSSLTIRGFVVWSLFTQKKRSEGFCPIYRTGIKFINVKDRSNILLHNESVIPNILNFSERYQMCYS